VTPSEVHAAIRSFVADNIGAEVADDVDIFAHGYVSSLFVIQLVVWLENELGVTVEAGGLEVASFATVARTYAFACARLGIDTGLSGAGQMAKSGPDA
jgi:methoxymalonate biosynthesis acyl carrier protein